MKENLSNLCRTCFNWHTADRPCDRECLVRVARLLIAIVSGRVHINFGAKRQGRKRRRKSGQRRARVGHFSPEMDEKDTVSWFLDKKGRLWRGESNHESERK